MDNKNWDHKGHDHKMGDDKMCGDKEKHHGKQCDCGCAHAEHCSCQHT